MKALKLFVRFETVLLFLVCVLFTSVAFSAEPVAGIPFLDKLYEWLSGVTSWQGIVAVVTVIEFIFRLVKTDKPKSIAWLIQSVLEQLSKIFKVLAEVLDVILPQRSK